MDNATKFNLSKQVGVMAIALDDGTLTARKDMWPFQQFLILVPDHIERIELDLAHQVAGAHVLNNGRACGDPGNRFVMCQTTRSHTVGFLKNEIFGKVVDVDVADDGELISIINDISSEVASLKDAVANGPEGNADHGAEIATLKKQISWIKGQLKDKA